MWFQDKDDDDEDQEMIAKEKGLSVSLSFWWSWWRERWMWLSLVFFSFLFNTTFPFSCSSFSLLYASFWWATFNLWIISVTQHRYLFSSSCLFTQRDVWTSRDDERWKWREEGWDTYTFSSREKREFKWKFFAAPFHFRYLILSLFRCKCLTPSLFFMKWSQLVLIVLVRVHPHLL